MHFRFSFFVGVGLTLVGAFAQADGRSSTPTGIPLEAKWKASVYSYAEQNIKHPSWGTTHSERNYWLTLEIARKEMIVVDTDVLFAASFLHDLGAIAAFEKAGVEHSARSVELAEPLLKSWGFPMEKWSGVREMILGHMFYAPASQTKQAMAFHDADVLDFLGALGAARILAVTLDSGPFHSLTLANPVSTISKFRLDLPNSLSLPASRQMARKRVQALDAFLKATAEEALNGRAY